MIKEENVYEKAVYDKIAINSDVKYSLSDCIDNLSDDVLKLFLQFRGLAKDNNIAPNDLNKLKKKFQKEILDSVKEGLSTFSPKEINILKEAVETGGIVQELNTRLIMINICFVFRKDNELIPVIPKEIVSLFKETYTDDFVKKNKYRDATMLLNGYTMFNGLFPRKRFEDLLKNYYKFDVSLDDEEMISEIKKSGIAIVDDYYILGDFEDSKELIDIVKNNQNSNYRIFSLDEMQSELMQFTKYYDTVQDIVGDEKLSATIFINLIILGPDDDTVQEYFKKLHEYLDIQTVRELDNFWDDYSDDIRMWILGGYTFNELDFDERIDDFIVSDKPKDNNLASWLNAINKEHASIIKDNYDVDELSKDDIIEEFTKVMNELDKYEILELLFWNNMEMNYSLDIEDLESAFLFVCEVNDKKIVFMPTELIKIAEDALANMKDNPKHRCPICGQIHDEDDGTANIVRGYLEMNGIIKKEKLQELLEVNHDIKLALDELDDIVEYCSCGVFDECYTVYEDDYNDMKNDMMALLPSKDKFTKYKVYDDASLDIVSNNTVELVDYVDDCGEFNYDQIEELISVLTMQAHLGIYYKGLLDELFKDMNVKVSSNVKKHIEKIFKKYKNDIPMWAYNGYSFNEVNEVHRSNQKVGRNDPCPCGSGKKYKKCCGK